MFPLGPLPHGQYHNTVTWVAHCGEYLRLHPLQHKSAQRQSNMAQMKEQIKTPEKQLSDEVIANLSNAQFNTMVMRMLTEMIEYGCKIEERVKATKRELNKNALRTNSNGKENGIQINSLEQKEEINIQPEQNAEIRIQKNE